MKNIATVFALILSAVALQVGTQRVNWGYMGGTSVTSPTVFKSVIFATPTGSSNAVWTPASGKKFRILRYRIWLSNDCDKSLSVGKAKLQLLDGSTDIGLNASIFLPNTAATTLGQGSDTGWVDVGPSGILSGAANNVLNFATDTTFATGNVTVMVAGTEE